MADSGEALAAMYAEADPEGCLAAIRGRHGDYLRLRAADDGSDASFWAVLAQAGGFAVADVPLLLRVVEAVLAVRPSMHEEHGPVPEECRFCAGEAAALRRVRETVNIQLVYGGDADATTKMEARDG